MLQKLVRVCRREGVGGIWNRARQIQADRTFSRAARSFVKGHSGLEIGGPSEHVFGDAGYLPLYRSAAGMDNCNFACETVWEGAIADRQSFTAAGRVMGTQFVCEATDLAFARTGCYRFVLSSHAFEHLANPLKAVAEVSRVLAPGGGFVLVLPHRDAAFDHRRPTTPFEHLLADEANGTREDDLTHLDEVLRLHDLERDMGAGDRATFEARSRRNSENRCLHHHVFDVDLARKMVEHGGFQVVMAARLRNGDIGVVAAKP